MASTPSLRTLIVDDERLARRELRRLLEPHDDVTVMGEAANADEAALNRPVPFMLVQTLAENGIKHGIARCQGGGVITINARVEDGDLCIRVTNPGTLETEEGGTGLANARERLRLLFGEEASLTVRNADAATVEATVVLPARPEAGGTVMQDESRAAVAAPG